MLRYSPITNPKPPLVLFNLLFPSLLRSFQANLIQLLILGKGALLSEEIVFELEYVCFKLMDGVVVGVVVVVIVPVDGAL